MATRIAISLVMLLACIVCTAQETIRPQIVFDGVSGEAVQVLQVENADGGVSAAVTPLPLPGTGVIPTPLPQPVEPRPGNATPETVPARRPVKSKIVPVLPKEYETLDKNGDGQIAMYEWDRSKYAEFTKLDKNGDGFLTPMELGAKGGAKLLRGGAGSAKDALPNPGNLSNYNQKIGETFAFSVTGRTTGSVWGTGTYTTDSDLATVAVHAGVLKDGEAGVVRVTIVQSPNQFVSSSANGVNSSAWQAFPVAYTVR